MIKYFCLLIAWISCFAAIHAQGAFSIQDQLVRIKKIKEKEAALQQVDSLALAVEAKDMPDSLALIYHTKSIIGNRFRDRELAISATKEAIKLREKTGDTTGLGNSYFNLGYFYKYIGQKRNAIQAFEEGVALGDGPANINYYLNCLIPLGQLERDLGDYSRAIQHLELGITHYQKVTKFSSRDSSKYALFLYTMGSVYNLLTTKEALEKSLVYLERAQAILEKMEPGVDLAHCYKEFGNSYSKLKNQPKAIDFYKKTIPVYRKVDDLAGTYNNLGIEYRKIKDFPNAIRNLQKGLNIITEDYGPGFHPEKAQFADNLADTYRDQGQYEKAMRYYQEAIQHNLPGFRPGDVVTNPTNAQLEVATDKEGLLTYLGDKAKGWIAYHGSTNNAQQLQHALATLQQADYLIDRMRQEHTAEASKLIWRREVHGIYELALDIAYQLSDEEQAFYFLEKSKSILLLDGLVAADARAIIPDSIAARERALNQSILKVQKELEASPDDPERRTRLLDEQKTLVELVGYLADTYPRYHELRYTAKVLSLEEAQSAHASARRLLVQYFWGENHVYIMPVSAKSAALLRIPRDKALDETLQRLIVQFQEASAILNAPGQYASDAYAVYQMLLAPVFALMPSAERRELTLILDGLLQYVPFEALLTEPPKRNNLSLLPYLVRDYKVQYAYSATILSKQSGERESRGSKAAVLGMAPFAAAAGELGQLPFSAAELNGIQKLAAGKYLLDADANSQSFLDAASQYAVLHLSTHASANEEQGKPFIYFYDQKVYLPDLYALELPAQLVVLSACETGLGKLQTGEGVMSLSRGFTFAGAQSLISSLWSVNDQSTADIFSAFYDQLGTGLRKSEALHQAKLAYLNNTKLTDDQKSPYYWAGFVYVGGDSRLALHPAPGTRWWWWASGGLLLLVGIRWWTRKN
jgi:CHAT domain-containing protein